MIDTSKTIRKLLDEGYAIAIFDAVVTQTSTPSKFMPALDVELLHKQLDRDGEWHDVKPWKTAVGSENSAAALIQSRAFLLERIRDQRCTLKSIMDENTTA